MTDQPLLKHTHEFNPQKKNLENKTLIAVHSQNLCSLNGYKEKLAELENLVHVTIELV